MKTKMKTGTITKLIEDIQNSEENTVMTQIIGNYEGTLIVDKDRVIYVLNMYNNDTDKICRWEIRETYIKIISMDYK